MEQRDQGTGFRLGRVLQLGLLVGDDRIAELLEELAGFVEDAVAHPGEQHHQHQKCANAEYKWMFHITP